MGTTLSDDVTALGVTGRDCCTGRVVRAGLLLSGPERVKRAQAVP